jgi:hypothetical protein
LHQGRQVSKQAFRSSVIDVGIQSTHDALHIGIVYTVLTLSSHVMTTELIDTFSAMLDGCLPAQQSHV